MRGFIGLVISLLLILGTPLRAENAATPHHPLHQDFYMKWMQPNSSMGCCNARVKTPDGGEVGDCEPVPAEIKNGSWRAWFPKETRWIDIPDDRIIRERNPEQGGPNGHLCYNEYTKKVLCFVPPDTGG